MALYYLLVMLLDHLNTKLRCLNYLKTCFQLEDLSIKVTLDQSNIVTFLADSVLFKEKFISPKVQIQIPQNLVEI